jgi:DNA replication licensing factor MCM4
MNGQEEDIIDDTATNLIQTNKTTRDFLAKYISYARKHIHPTIPESLVESLVHEYMRMRSAGNTRKTITATPRQLESLIRIAESNAKMRLSQEVEQKDINEATRLIQTAMQQSATDPNTGEIDLDIITTGVSRTSAERIREICNYIKVVHEKFAEKVNFQGLKYTNLFDYMKSKAQSGEIGTKDSPFLESEL